MKLQVNHQEFSSIKARFRGGIEGLETLLRTQFVHASNSQSHQNIVQRRMMFQAVTHEGIAFNIRSSLDDRFSPPEPLGPLHGDSMSLLHQ
jgi:hypothetical protein